MDGKNKVTRNPMGQVPGREQRSTEKLNPKSVPHRKAKRHNSGAPYRVIPSTGDPFGIVVTGRVRWALNELRNAGLTGCTPIKNPAPRWSAYIHELRGMGVEIETITEPHEGDFPGHHGRYVLRSGVARDWKGGAQ